MRPATIEERVRDFVEAERSQVPVPRALASRILHAVEVSRPSPRRPRRAYLQVAAAVAALLLLGIGIGWMRTTSMTASTQSGPWSSIHALPLGTASECHRERGALRSEDPSMELGGVPERTPVWPHRNLALER